MFEQVFKTATKELKDANLVFCVAGTVAAQLYRDTSQATANLTFLTSSPEALPVSLKLFSEFDLEPFVSEVFENEFAPRFPLSKTPHPKIITGRAKKDFSTVNLGFIFNDFPWCASALARAQNNLVSYGEIFVPVLTVEDVILSKLFNLSISPSPLDEDDLIHILKAEPQMDLIYLCGEMNRLNLPFPREFSPNLPEELRKMSNFIRKTQDQEPERGIAR